MGTTKISPPAPRNYGQEMADTLQAQVDLAPELYAAEAQYSPLYAQLEMDNLRKMFQGTEGSPGLISLYENEIAPSLDRIQREAQRTQREADVSDVERYAPRMREALREANPENTALLDKLNEQAMSELAAGDRLTPDQLRDIGQQSRSVFASRGLNQSPASGIAELVNQQVGGQNLKRQRQAFAQSLVGQNQGVYGDPFMAILGRPSGTVAATQGFGQQGMGLNQATGPTLFNPESGYAQDLYNTNLNMLWNTRAANADASNAMKLGYMKLAGDTIQAAGSAVGGYMAGGCWVAREVYGWDNPKWLIFRSWVTLDAPEWFRKAYMKHGERVAGIIRRCGWLKPSLRRVMDRILRKAGYGV